MQYSYLPSWISFLVDGPKAAEAGTALNEAVHAWWSRLPAGPDRRCSCSARAWALWGPRQRSSRRTRRHPSTRSRPVATVSCSSALRPRTTSGGRSKRHEHPRVGLGALVCGWPHRAVHASGRKPSTVRGVVGGAPGPVRAPPIRPGGQLDDPNVMGAAAVDRQPDRGRRPRERGVVPLCHVAPGDGRPRRGVQLRAWPRTQLRRGCSRRLGDGVSTRGVDRRRW